MPPRRNLNQSLNEIFHRGLRFLVPLLLVSGLCVVGALEIAAFEKKAVIDLFPTDRVMDVQITVAEEDWDKIRKQTRNFFEALQASRKENPVKGPYVYVNAAVTIDGVEFPDVGIRKKGFIGSQNANRPSLKIKLNYVDKKAKLGGQTVLTFNNNNQDTSQMSQFMGYALFNAAGSPAPRCALARLTVNGKNLGVYSHVEPVRKPLLRRGFGNDRGTVYEGTVTDFFTGWEGSFERKIGKDRRARRKIKQLIEVLQGEISGTTLLGSQTVGRGWVPTGNGENGNGNRAVYPGAIKDSSLKDLEVRIARLRKTLATVTPELAAAQKKWEVENTNQSVTLSPWSVIGPFQATSFDKAFEHAFPPEIEIDLAKAYAKDGKEFKDDEKSKDDGKSAAKLSLLIVDGQNNHNWRATTQVLRDFLIRTGRFNVDVATSPGPRGTDEAWAKFRPAFEKFDVVLSNYNGQAWPAPVQAGLVKYIGDGGAMVNVHAANNAFPQWVEFNKMIGLGWRGNGNGSRITIDDNGKVVRTPKGQGPGAGHGPEHPFSVVTRDRQHPVMRGIPAEWMHFRDELYHGLRGPALNMQILATAYSAEDKGGTSANEPMVWWVPYGKGRVFTTVMGHGDYSMKCVGFQTIVGRGAEWAATGKVTLPVPKNFPTAQKTSVVENRRAAPLRWVEVKNIRDGRPFPLRPQPFSATYLFRTITSPTARKLAAILGSDDGIKLWLNGKLQFEKQELRNVLPATDRTELNLVAGKNRILMKIINSGGPAGLFFRPLQKSFPPPVLAALSVPAVDRNKGQKKVLTDYHLAIAPSLQPVREELATLAAQHYEHWTALDFDASSWTTGRNGAGYETGEGFESLISEPFDFQGDMFEKSASMYLRFPFELEDLAAVRGDLILRMKYDDGFVAYLNGHRIASANAPNPIRWNSRATRGHNDPQAVEFEGFNISEHRDKFRKGKNVLAIHGLNVAPGSTDMLILPEIQVNEITMEQAIGELVDLDAFYRFWAIEGLLGFWDGYSANRNNYFIYLNPESDKFHFLPWGGDCMFEKRSRLRVDPRAPISVKTMGRVAHKLYQVKSVRERYLKTLKQIMAEHWDEDQLIAETHRIEGMLKPGDLAPSQVRTMPGKLVGLRQFINTRRSDIEKETAGGMPIWKAAPGPPPQLQPPNPQGRGNPRPANADRGKKNAGR